jgi:hypothetical protein
MLLQLLLLLLVSGILMADTDLKLVQEKIFSLRVMLND